MVHGKVRRPFPRHAQVQHLHPQILRLVTHHHRATAHISCAHPVRLTHLSGLSTSSSKGTPKTLPLPFAPPRRLLLPITNAPGYPPPSAPAADKRARSAEAAAAATSAAAASGSSRADVGAGLPPRSSTHPSPGLVRTPPPPPPPVLLWGLALVSPKMSLIVSSSDWTAWGTWEERGFRLSGRQDAYRRNIIVAV